METLHRNASDLPVLRLPTRIRFSLRLVFVAVTLSAVALFWFAVRPTVMANRFVTAIEKRDYATAKSLLVDKRVWVFEHGPQLFAAVDLIYAEILPRDWSDVLACRRRIIFRVGYHEDTNGGHVEWTSDSDGVASSNGIELTSSSFHSATVMPPNQPLKIPDYTLVP